MKTTRRPTERSGLHLRPQMDQIVNYLTYCQEKVRFPDRTARLVRNHPFMTQLDFFDMQEAQEIQWEEQQQRHAAAEAAREMGLGVAETVAEFERRDQGVNTDDFGGDGSEDEDFFDAYQDAMAEQAENIIRNEQSMQHTVQQQFNEHPGTIPTIQSAANIAREEAASGSGQTPIQRITSLAEQISRDMRQRAYAAAAYTPAEQISRDMRQRAYAAAAYTPAELAAKRARDEAASGSGQTLKQQRQVPQTPQAPPLAQPRIVHLMGHAAPFVLPPRPNPPTRPATQAVLRVPPRAGTRSRSPPSDPNVVPGPAPTLEDLFGPASAPVSRSRSNRPPRFTSADHRAAEAPAVVPKIDPAPVSRSRSNRAPKIAPAPVVDVNARLGYPPSLPRPPQSGQQQAKAKAKAKAIAKAKKSASYSPSPLFPPPLPPPPLQPADQGGAAVPLRGIPKRSRSVPPAPPMPSLSPPPTRRRRTRAPTAPPMPSLAPPAPPMPRLAPPAPPMPRLAPPAPPMPRLAQGGPKRRKLK